MDAKRPVVKRKERELSAAIIKLLQAHGIMAWRTGGGAFKIDGRYVRMGTRGVSDVLACMPYRRYMGADLQIHEIPEIGRLVAIEVKSPTGRVRPEQTAFLFDVMRHGGIGFVARSVDDVVQKLGLGR